MPYKGENPFIKDISLAEWIDTREHRIHTLVSMHAPPDTPVESLDPKQKKTLKQIRREAIEDYLIRFYDDSKTGTDNYKNAELVFLSFILVIETQGRVSRGLKRMMSSDAFIGIRSDKDKTREVTTTMRKYA